MCCFSLYYLNWCQSKTWNISSCNQQDRRIFKKLWLLIIVMFVSHIISSSFVPQKLYSFFFASLVVCVCVIHHISSLSFSFMLVNAFLLLLGFLFHYLAYTSVFSWAAYFHKQNDWYDHDLFFSLLVIIVLSALKLPLFLIRSILLFMRN